MGRETNSTSKTHRGKRTHLNTRRDLTNFKRTGPDVLKAYGGLKKAKEKAEGDVLAWVYAYKPQINLPGKGYVDYEPFWCQRQVLADRSKFRHVNKSRQIGFTTTFAIEAVHHFIYTPHAEIIVLSKSEKEAKKFLDKFYVAYDSVESKMGLRPLRARNRMNAESMDGSTIEILTSSKGAGRSFSATRFYMDEMAHTLFADDIYQAALPTISTTGGFVTLFSSPKGRSGLFAEIGRNTEDQGFSQHIFEWFFSPHYNPVYEEFLHAYHHKEYKKLEKLKEEAKQGNWYQTMRGKFTELGFAQEYEASYDADVDTVFSAIQLKKAFKKAGWLREEENPLALEFLTADPEEGHQYTTGIDLGRKRDATVIVTFDTTYEKAILVEFKRLPPASADWGMIEESIRETYDKLESDMIHDATGVGDAISERIIDISEPFQLMKSPKYNAIENLRRAMDNEAIQLPRIARFWREFEEYKWDDKHLVQDIVIAVALATKLYYTPEQIWTGAMDLNYVEGY